MSLDSIVSISIDAQTTSPTQKGFGVPLVVGYHTNFAERTRSYTSLAALLADGFTTSSAIYKAVAAILSQNPRVESVLVGRLTTPSTMTMNLTPAVANNALYRVTINGQVFDYTSDGTATATEIVNGLVALINAAGPLPVTASNVADVLRLVADTPGQVFSLEIDYARWTTIHNATTDGSGIAAQLAAISLENDAWYALVMDSHGEAEILAAAAYIETVEKIFIAVSGDSDVLTALTTDVASDLESFAYARTALMFHRKPHQYANAAWVGTLLPTTPGEATWKFKTLAGVQNDTFTETQLNNLTNKNANLYQEVAGINITQEGVTSSGEFIDVTTFVDWLKARMQERIFAILANLPKVPFTDAGIALIEGAIRAQLDQGVEVGGLNPDGIQVIVPKASDVPQNDRAARRLTGISFQGVLAGAVHSVVINGTVTV